MRDEQNRKNNEYKFKANESYLSDNIINLLI